MKNKKTRFLLIACETLFLSAIMLLSVFPLSCRVSVAGLEIVGSGCTYPVLENYEVIDEKNLNITFSDEVNLVSLSISKEEESEPEQGDISISYSSDGKTVIATLDKETDIGLLYIITGEVADAMGSTLTFSFPFSGYNGNPAKLLLTEVMDGVKTTGSIKTYEFIEFYVLEKGNLAGLKVCSINDGPDSDYSFPPLFVNTGDLVTLHLRPNTGTGEENLLICSNELKDKKESSASGSSQEAWDLWADNTNSRLGGTQDVITLENQNTGKILQCLSYSKNDKNSWSKEKFQTKTDQAFEDGTWAPDSQFENTFFFSTSASFVRTNTEEIIKAYNQGELSYPVPADSSQWKRITQSQVTPGKI